MTTDPEPPQPTPPPLPGWDRELRPSAAAAGALALVALTWTVWRNSGSRVSLFVCVATAAVAIVDVVWSQLATSRVRVAVTANPAEALVGDAVFITLALQGPRQFLRVRLRSFGSDRDVGVDVPMTGPVGGVAATREVLTEVVVELVSHGLAGFVACARRRPVTLARPLAVGPRPLPTAQPLPDLLRTWGDGEARPSASGDLVRGVRPYLPGDPQRRVHWRASARVGDLVVKEVEDTGAPRLLLALDLGGGGGAGEAAAGRAAWYAFEGLRRGYHVVLVSAELSRRYGDMSTRTVTGPVASPSEVIRRLAAAGLGTPALPEDVQPGGTLVVTDRGDSWR